MATLLRTGNIILTLAIVAIFSIPTILPQIGVIEAGPSGRTLIKGDWSVVGDEPVSNETIVLTGNLTIGTGAELTLDNVLLSIGLSKDRGFRIFVHNGGSLILNNTTIRSGSQGLRYEFAVMDGGFFSNGSNIYDFSGLSISGSEATLIKTNLMGNEGTAILLDRSTMVMTGCNVLVSGNGFGIEVVNSTAVLRSTMLKNLGAPENIGIYASGETSVTVDGGGIYDFSTGIYDRADWLRVKGAHISGASADGIFQIASYSDIRDSFFVDNLDGIHIIGGITNISGNDITAKGRGIAIDGGLITVEGNTVWSSDIGIEVVYTSQDVIKNNTLRDNGIGLSLNDSIEEPIFGNTFEGNDIGLFAISSRTNITDCTFFSKNVDLDLIDSAITMLNSTYFKDSLDNSSALSAVWLLDVFVRNGTGKALANATVEILDDWVGWPIILKTDLDGWVRNVELKQFVKSDGRTTNRTPYHIKASIGPYSGEALIELTRSMSVNITVDEIDLFLEYVVITGLETPVNSSILIEVSCDSDTHPVYNVTVELLDGGVPIGIKTLDLYRGPMGAMFHFSSDKPGLHNLTVIIDRVGNFRDNNRSNNVDNITINVTDEGENAADLPDLVPLSISPATGSGTIGTRVDITVDVENSGTANATNVMVELRIDGDTVGKRSISSIPAGGMGRVVFSWTTTTGKHNLWVAVDPDDLINESNETNNLVQTEVDLTGSTTDPAQFDTLAMVCGIIALVIFLVIGLLIFVLTRKPKQTQPGYYQYHYQYQPQSPQVPSGPGPYGAPPAKPTSAPITGKDERILGPGTNMGIKPTTVGKETCSQCGSTNFRTSDGGRKECAYCRKPL